MNPVDESLLKELQASLEDKILQKAILAAYLKKPSSEGIVEAVLVVLEKAAVKK